MLATAGGRARGAALIMLATAAAAAALAGGQGATAGSSGGGVLRMNVSNSHIAGVDPALGADNLSGQVGLATCARLVGYPDRNGAAGGRIVPDAATGLPRVSSGGRVYTFTVRNGWRFSDGSPLTAASFRRAYERA